MSRRTLTRAARFVLLVGAVSFFADLTYEGSRSVVGPFLGSLGASALAISAVAGLGELLGYGLRLVSGRLADRSDRYWPITLVGYALQMAAVPALALAGTWQAAALLVVLERVGKAVRNPPRDAMLSHAGQGMGYGWAFGVHEALDQLGALAGPLVVAAAVALAGGGYRPAFASLAIPAALTLALLGVARSQYPHPRELETAPPHASAAGLPRAFWVYLVGAGLVAAGFADFPLIAYHLQGSGAVAPTAVPLLYAVAMAADGVGALVVGRLFDRVGIRVLVPLTLLGALFAPLVFLGGARAGLLGAGLWGLAMGVHESIVPAAVAPMVPPHRRASAYGVFTGVYGVAWFLGSLAMGGLFGVSLGAVVGFSLLAELAAIPAFLAAAREAEVAAARVPGAGSPLGRA